MKILKLILFLMILLVLVLYSFNVKAEESTFVENNDSGYSYELVKFTIDELANYDLRLINKHDNKEYYRSIDAILVTNINFLNEKNKDNWEVIIVKVEDVKHTSKGMYYTKLQDYTSYAKFTKGNFVVVPENLEFTNLLLLFTTRLYKNSLRKEFKE